MLQLNPNHNKGKKPLLQIFKLPFSLNGSVFKKEKLIDENNTKEIEHKIGHVFIGYLRNLEKKEIMFFSPNEKDDHKNPDLYLITKSNKIGVQIVQFVVRHYIKRFNEAKKTCEELSDYISKIFKPPIKINIQISTPWESDKIPKGNKKLYKKLAKKIAHSIEGNIDKLKNENAFPYFDLSNSEFKQIAESYNLLAVPNHLQSHYFGNNNIYIDYGYDYIQIFKEDIIETADKIFSDKNNGKAEILVVWADSLHYSSTMIYIVNALNERFSNTSFESVYFLSFPNSKEVEQRYGYCKIK